MSSKNNFGILANLDYDEIFPSLSGANPKAPIKERSIVVNESRGATISSEPVRDYDCAEEGRRLERLTMVALKRAKTGRSPLSQEEVNHLESWLARYRASNDQTNQIIQSVASNLLGVSAPLTDQVDPAPTIQVSAISEKPREIEEGHSKDVPRASPSDEPPTSETEDGGDSGSGSDGSKSEESEQEGEGDTSVLDVSPHPIFVDRNGEMKDDEGGNEERDTDSEANALVDPNVRVAVSKKDGPNDEHEIITEKNARCARPVEGFTGNVDHVQGKGKPLENSSEREGYVMHGVCSQAYAPHVFEKYPVPGPEAQNKQVPVGEAEQDFGGPSAHLDEGLVAEEPGIAYIPVVEAGMKSWANVVATGAYLDSSSGQLSGPTTLRVEYGDSSIVTDERTRASRSRSALRTPTGKTPDLIFKEATDLCNELLGLTDLSDYENTVVRHIAKSIETEVYLLRKEKPIDSDRLAAMEE
ncbi:hypothetical protein U1Q18_032692 [Sarracenia purpurea var. burkii]